MKTVELRTPRAVLAAPCPADVDAIFGACQDVDIQRWTAVPSPYEQQHAVGFVEQAAGAWDQDSGYTWAIHVDGELCGMIDLRRQAAGAAEMGCWIAAPARRRGLLIEAATAAIDWGFAADGAALKRIEWRAGVGNLASARSAQALGFQHEGTLRLGLPLRDGLHDCWIAGLLSSDDRAPRHWPVLRE